ncbi:MAG: SusC/RagA family TonB-linked outer membrane protein [Bacteroidota bacterium]|nr:SusC/RagA family TonB-linked outer membrane protein [Bacteroidota bacterium]
MKRLAMFIAFFVCVGLHLTTAQTVQITGTVTSKEDGQPLPGVSVTVKGTNIGTATDFQGKYSLSVPTDAKTLVVKFIGMKTQEVTISGKSTIDIALESDAVGLNEVVVTGLGIKRSEKSLGYAATNISSDELTASRDKSALNALQGKVAGVNISSSSGAPGASSRIFMRGYSTLAGSNQPLFIIDGVPLNNGAIVNTDINGGTDFGNRLNDISPDDIESINIVKGASGAALYGSRATNGVIIITTKSGKNRQNKGALIEVTSSVVFDSPLRTPLFQNEFGQGWYDGTLAANLEENGSFGPKFDGKLRVWGHILNNQQKYKPYVALENNFKDFFDIGTTFNNSVSITNGNDNSSYYLSYNNVSSDGIMPTNADSYKRNNFSLRGSSKFMKNFTASASFNYVKKDSKFVPTGQSQSVMDGLFQLPRDISIVDQKDYKDPFNNADNYFTVFAQNPYFVLNEHGNKQTENRVYGNVGLEYVALPWLTATFRLGGDVSNSQLKEWRAIYNSVRATYEKEDGRVKESSYNNQEVNTDFFLTINKSLSQNLKINAILGHSFNERQVRNLSAQVIGLDIPNFYQLSNSASTPTVTEFESKRRIVGVYANVDISYKDFLFLNVLGRNDWSSTLPANNRSYFYPSASVSFLFSELLPSLKGILPYGKLRVGVAQTGNDADPYQLNTVFVQAAPTDGYRSLTFPLPLATGGTVNGFTVSNILGNPDLKPERTIEKEIGADLRFFDSRLKFDVSYYDKVSRDLIWNVTLPRSTGFSSKTMNVGEITNKGIELLITVVPVKTKDFTWELSWNYTNNKNRISKLNEGLTQVSLGGVSTLGFIGLPNEPIGLLQGSQVQTDPKGHVVVNNQGLPVQSPDLKVYGNTQYNYISGLNTLLTYKGISLSATIDIRQGGIMYSRTAEMLYFTGNGAQTTYNDRQPFIIPNSVQLINGEYVENTTPIAGSSSNMNLYYSQTYGAGNFQKSYTIPKSFVKLRQVVLSYQLPKKIVNGTFLQNVEFSLIGRNLLIWTPKSNTFVDPEMTTFGNDLGGDFGEYGATPTTRSYGASIKFSF